MAKHRVCPWWLGYLLACPIRRWLDDSVEALLSYARQGMTVLEPGPGMGFFTLELARRVGPSGRVIALDVQPKMLDVLKGRARKAGLEDRIETRLVQPDSMALAGLAEQIDLAFACAVVHEMPDSAAFFNEISEALKPGGQLLLAEPKGHVKDADFEAELTDAARAGLTVSARPIFRRNHAALLTKR